MLILTRRQGETIRVVTPDGDEIEFKYLESGSPGQIKVGIKCPNLEWVILRVSRENEIETGQKKP